MTNSRAKGAQRLDTHKATGAEGSYTFTPTTPLDMVDKYSRIVIYIRGEATAAFTLELILNGFAGTTYQYIYTQNDGGTISGVQTSGTAEAMIIPIGQMGTDFGFSAKIEIWVKSDGSNDNLYGSYESAADTAATIIGSFINSTATADTITSIKLETSTSTWKAQTQINIYGVEI